jgi:hypothetical protein
MVGLLEHRREQDQFRTRCGDLAYRPDAVGWGARDRRCLDVGRQPPVEPRKRGVNPRSRTARVFVYRDVYALGDRELLGRPARLGERLAHNLDLAGEPSRGRGPRAKEAASYDYYNFEETPTAAAAVLPPASARRLQEIKAAYDPRQVIISADPAPT